MRRSGGRAERLERLALLAQGSYYVATGIWPLLHMRSFERVTGPKSDRSLVRTVGALVAAIGVTLLQAALRRRVPAEVQMLAGLAAAGFLAVEVPPALRGRIAPIYLADAAFEAAFLAAYASGGGHESPGVRRERPLAEDARQ